MGIPPVLHQLPHGLGREHFHVQVPRLGEPATCVRGIRRGVRGLIGVPGVLVVQAVGIFVGSHVSSRVIVRGDVAQSGVHSAQQRHADQRVDDVMLAGRSGLVGVEDMLRELGRGSLERVLDCASHIAAVKPLASAGSEWRDDLRGLVQQRLETCSEPRDQQSLRDDEPKDLHGESTSAVVCRLDAHVQHPLVAGLGLVHRILAI
mmetsp:Transcript_89491/g.283249  ORF Transcript_89491/g.283249 Transcript_89491/m.283249 type:complete len:205 (-) Transcript_89491:1481-2095(-)